MSNAKEEEIKDFGLILSENMLKKLNKIIVTKFYLMKLPKEIIFNYFAQNISYDSYLKMCEILLPKLLALDKNNENSK